MKHTIVYRNPNRFAAWPANHGIWSWGNEILVGFFVGELDQTIKNHPLDTSKSQDVLFYRSHDGGLTWALDNVGSGLHCQTYRQAQSHELCTPHSAYYPGGLTPPSSYEPRSHVDFKDPNSIMTFCRSANNHGISWYFLSKDKGKYWQGPYFFDMFDEVGVMARTCYIPTGKLSCIAFITVAHNPYNTQGPTFGEGRVIIVKTTDGGASWHKLNKIDMLSQFHFEIMPSAVKADNKIIIATRLCAKSAGSISQHTRSRKYSAPFNLGCIGIHHYFPETNTIRHLGVTGLMMNTSSPPSLVRLPDGQLSLTYGRREKPYGIQTQLSDNEGMSWSDPYFLRNDGGNWDIGYVASTLNANNDIVSTYYYNFDPINDTRWIGATVWNPNELDESMKTPPPTVRIA